MSDVRIAGDGPDVLLWVKAVPGASRDAIAGAMGDRLKIRVSAPPEAGKANESICRLIAGALRIKRREVTIDGGHTSPLKTIRIAGADVATVRIALDPG